MLLPQIYSLDLQQNEELQDMKMWLITHTKPRLRDSAVKYASWTPSGTASGGVLLAENQKEYKCIIWRHTATGIHTKSNAKDDDFQLPNNGLI